MPLMDRHPDTLRLFFALWPDPGVRTQLAALLPEVRGRRVQPANLHLTLAFLGRQPVERLAALLAIAGSIPFPAITVVIDQLGYFRRNRIAWAGMQHPPSELLGVQRQLTDALDQAGIEFDAGNRFHPHVTLARDAQAPASLQAAPVYWKPDRIALVSSVPSEHGVVYEVVTG